MWPKLSEIVNRVEKSDFLSASLYEAQADYRRHGDEIAVIVKEEEVVFQGYLGNETVDRAPNSDSLSATGKIDAGCLGV